MVIVALLMTVVAAACRQSFTARRAAAPLMVGAFQSYSSIGDVRRIAPQVSVVKDDLWSDGSTRPQYRVTTLRIARYTHLGVQGTIELHFFNDRLMTVAFTPDDLPVYLVALRTKGISLDPARNAPFVIGRKVEVRTIRGHALSAVVWTDRRLSKEMESWVARYS